MQKYISVFLFFMVCTLSTAQISHGGQPIEMASEVQTISLQLPVKPSSLRRQAEVSGKLPLRFAEPIFTNLTPQNSGVWEEGVDGMNVWRLALKSGGAKSLNLIFDKFCLKEDDCMFVYNPQRTHVLGSFTKENNNPSKLFAIAPIAGDEIIIELQTKSPIRTYQQIEISAVNHDFIGIVELLKYSGDFDKAHDCNVDVICETINPEEINRSVCKIIIDGSLLCSGTMLNNTNQDGRPYFLSAAHCFDTPKDASGNLTAQNVVFYFNFESPNCNPIVEGTDVQTLSGAQLRAYVENMDFALLEMNKTPPETYRPYWAGWKRDQIISGPVYSIHHPQGDVKKVAVSNNAPIATSFTNPEPGGVEFLKEIHWQIELWDKGTTEGGSSGSGLFSDKYFIGSLSGGEAYCGNSVNDYYARFNEAWSRNASDAEQLAKWLDPQGSNAEQLSGFDLYEGSTVRYSPKEKDDAIQVVYDDQFKGSWSGHNERGYEAYANYYYDVNRASLEGIYFVPAKSVPYSTQTINVKVWDGFSGEPGAVLWSKENVAIGSLSGNREALVSIEPALNINNRFFVGVEINYINPVDTFSLYQITMPNSTLNPANRAYIRDNSGLWNGFDKLHSTNEKGAYWIDLLLKDADFTTDTGDIEVVDKYLKILINPITNGEIRYNTNIENLNKAEIFAINGSKVKQTLLNGTNKVEVHGLPSGLYLVKFSSSKETIVKRVVIVQ